MSRDLDDARRWMQQGTKLLLGATEGLDEGAMTAPTLLPGWTRKHLIAHVAANAEALGRLVHWAATGQETPMYASSEARAREIEEGAIRPATELAAWLSRSADNLAAAMAELDTAQWERLVVTAQGRTVPATEVPWLRAREVCVHSVDLANGVGFADLPADFLEAMCEDIRTKRGADLLGVIPEGPLPEVAAWLAGRPHSLADAPAIGPWL